MSLIKDVRISNLDGVLPFKYGFSKAFGMAGFPAVIAKNWYASGSLVANSTSFVQLTQPGYSSAARFVTLTGSPSGGYVAGAKFTSSLGDLWYGVQLSGTSFYVQSHAATIPSESNRSVSPLQFAPVQWGVSSSNAVWFLPFKQDSKNYLMIFFMGLTNQPRIDGFFILPFPIDANGKEMVYDVTAPIYGGRKNTSPYPSISYVTTTFTGEVYDFAGRMDYLTFDPGESPLAAISRASEGLNMGWFSRYNGNFTVYQSYDKTSEASLWTASAASSFGDSVFSEDKRGLVSHIRVVGAYAEADVIDSDNLERVGHVYAEVNNPFLLSDQDAQAEAIRLIRRSKQDANQLQFSTKHNPLMEPEDKITFVNIAGVSSTWIVNGYSVSTTAGVCTYTFSCRRLV